MARREIEVGATGKRAAVNLAGLRERRRMSQAELAGRVTELGRPMSASVVSKTEKQDRRIDVDDLMAFAVALGVNPNALLFDRTASRSDLIDLAPELRQRAWAVWEWAEGRSPLPEADIGDSRGFEVAAGALADFAEHARPAAYPLDAHPAVRETGALLTRLLAVLGDTAGRDDGGLASRERHVRRALQRVTIAIDELFDSATAAGAVQGGGVRQP